MRTGMVLRGNPIAAALVLAALAASAAALLASRPQSRQPERGTTVAHEVSVPGAQPRPANR